MEHHIGVSNLSKLDDSRVSEQYFSDTGQLSRIWAGMPRKNTRLQPAPYLKLFVALFVRTFPPRIVTLGA